ncbi:PREDICTED: uncharacterized protein LOC104710853 [Camelina sativa]|uniref:Uncharacterized protein LOC104710853 n=1 Tax=Camelina sativa TaxID=90675 RepID=A0ABM0TFW8_CAMSA|nr:PREDICTED: uncharacterized protein LOC104710853 [Camelina sativa]
MKKRTNTEPSASGAKKRRREEDDEEVGCSHAAVEDDAISEDQYLPLEDELTFSDTSVALRMMRAQFPRIDQASVPPFILQSQLYSSVNDRTQVDRELECLRREKVVDRIVKRMEEKKQSNLEIVKWFKGHVLDSKLEPSIGHHELFSLLSLGGKVKDAHITILINAGLLVSKDLYSYLYLLLHVSLTLF